MYDEVKMVSVRKIFSVALVYSVLLLSEFPMQLCWFELFLCIDSRIKGGLIDRIKRKSLLGT